MEMFDSVSSEVVHKVKRIDHCHAQTRTRVLNIPRNKVKSLRLKEQWLTLPGRSRKRKLFKHLLLPDS